MFVQLIPVPSVYLEAVLGGGATQPPSPAPEPIEKKEE